MFELTSDELSRCQIGTLNKGRGSNFKYMPFAFTEIGVAMLSGVLKSKVAVQANHMKFGLVFHSKRGGFDPQHVICKEG